MYTMLAELLETTMNKTQEVTIFLSDIEAKKWIMFQQYYSPFSLMVESGVFLVKNGSVALHFDAIGMLKSIHRADVLYDARFNK